MIDFFKQLWNRDASSSKQVAKERLRLVLVHDRVNVSPNLLEALKEDLLEVISKYMEINDKGSPVYKLGLTNDDKERIQRHAFSTKS